MPDFRSWRDVQLAPEPRIRPLLDVPDGTCTECCNTPLCPVAEVRDRAITEAQNATAPLDRETWVARAAAFRHALTLLNIHTIGEFGEAESDQPNPYEVPTIKVDQ